MTGVSEKIGGAGSTLRVKLEFTKCKRSESSSAGLSSQLHPPLYCLEFTAGESNTLVFQTLSQIDRASEREMLRRHGRRSQESATSECAETK